MNYGVNWNCTLMKNTDIIPYTLGVYNFLIKDTCSNLLSDNKKPSSDILYYIFLLTSYFVFQVAPETIVMWLVLFLYLLRCAIYQYGDAVDSLQSVKMRRREVVNNKYHHHSHPITIIIMPTCKHPASWEKLVGTSIKTRVWWAHDGPFHESESQTGKTDQYCSFYPYTAYT